MRRTRKAYRRRTKTRRLLKGGTVAENSKRIIDAIINENKDAFDVIMTELKASGKNINQLSSYTTPLIVAASMGDVDKVQALIDAGADVNAQVRFGSPTALHAATQERHVEIIRRLLAAGANPFQIFFSADDTEGLESLLAGGVPVDVVSTKGKTPLMEAAFVGNPDSVKLLLEAGADPNKLNPNTGLSPLHYAAMGLGDSNNNHIATIQTLVDAGANPAYRDFSNMKPIDYVDSKEYPRAFQLLQSLTPASNISNNLPLAALPATYEEALHSIVVVNCANPAARLPAQFKIPRVSMVLGEGDDAADVLGKHLAQFNIFVCNPEWLGGSPQPKRRFLENVQAILKSRRTDKIMVVVDFRDAAQMDVFKRVFAGKARYILVEGHGEPISYTDANVLLMPGGTYENNTYMGRANRILMNNDVQSVLETVADPKADMGYLTYIGRVDVSRNSDRTKLKEALETTIQRLMESPHLFKIPVQLDFDATSSTRYMTEVKALSMMMNIVGLLHVLMTETFGEGQHAKIITGNKMLFKVSKGIAVNSRNIYSI